MQARDATCPLYFSPYINVLIEGTNNRKCINHTKGKCSVNMCSTFCDPVNNFSATCSCTCGCQHSLGVAVVVVGLSPILALSTSGILNRFYHTHPTLTFFVPSKVNLNVLNIRQSLRFSVFKFCVLHQCHSDILIYIQLGLCFAKQYV